MNGRFWIVRGGMALAVWGSGWLLAGRAPAQSKAPSQPFQLGSKSETSTNSNPLGAKRDGLKLLEDDLTRSFQSFKPKSSLDGLAAPRGMAPPRQMRPNKRALELEERRRNLIFMQPEDLEATPTLEEFFNLPQYGADGREKKKLTPLERFFQGTERRRSAAKKPSPFAPEDPMGYQPDRQPDETGKTDESNLPSETHLKKMLGRETTRSFIPPLAHGTLSDIFGLGGNELTPEQKEAHRDYMKRFQQLLDSPAPGLGANPANPLAGPTDPARALMNPSSALMGSSASSRPEAAAQFGGLGSLRDPGLLSDPNARLLNQWNPLYTPPALQPPKSTAPMPNFDVPRRKF